MYSTRTTGGKRAVGFKLSDGMEVPGGARVDASSSRGRSRSSPGTIRGSFFVIKGEY